MLIHVLRIAVVSLKTDRTQEGYFYLFCRVNQPVLNAERNMDPPCIYEAEACI